MLRFFSQNFAKTLFASLFHLPWKIFAKSSGTFGTVYKNFPSDFIDRKFHPKFSNMIKKAVLIFLIENVEKINVLFEQWSPNIRWWKYSRNSLSLSNIHLISKLRILINWLIKLIILYNLSVLTKYLIISNVLNRLHGWEDVTWCAWAFRIFGVLWWVIQGNYVIQSEKI